jgi:hypothetical protein
MLASASGDCHAEDAQPPRAWREPRRTEETEWYGWQLLISDSATLGLATAVGVGTKSFGNGLVVVAIGMVGPPLAIHAFNSPDDGMSRYFLHRWGGAAFGALAPLLFVAASDGGVRFKELKGWHVGLGAGIGALIGTGLDIGFASRTRATTTGALPRRFTLAPMGLGVSASGSF